MAVKPKTRKKCYREDNCQREDMGRDQDKTQIDKLFGNDKVIDNKVPAHCPRRHCYQLYLDETPRRARPYLGYTIKGYFGGKHESAKTPGKLIKEMIKAVKKDKSVKYIIVNQADRFSRNAGQAINIHKTDQSYQ